jgi:hypothetical protein
MDRGRASWYSYEQSLKFQSCKVQDDDDSYDEGDERGVIFCTKFLNDKHCEITSLQIFHLWYYSKVLGMYLEFGVYTNTFPEKLILLCVGLIESWKQFFKMFS